jgi:hypothetical protein
LVGGEMKIKEEQGGGGGKAAEMRMAIRSHRRTMGENLLEEVLGPRLR